MSLCNGLFALVVCSKKLLGLPAVASSVSVLHVLEECDLVDTGEDVNASVDGVVFVCRIANIMAIVVVVIVRVLLLLSLLFGRHLLRQEHLLILSFFMVIIYYFSSLIYGNNIMLLVHPQYYWH